MKFPPLTTPAQFARNSTGWTIFHSLRLVENVLGPGGLRGAALPVARALAALDGRKLDQHRPGPFARKCLFHPDAFSEAAWREARVRFHLSRVLCTLPDRLVLPRWRERCRIEGEANLLAARAGGRPVILATLHYGGLLLLRYWLRVLGHPAATLVREQLAQRSPLKRRKDALSATDAGPVVFSGQSPRAAMRHLRAGGLLTVVLDHAEGRLIEAPLPGGHWRISSAAQRLAAASGAMVLPTLVGEPAPWRFVIHVGRPVPGEWLADARQFPAAAGHLWNEFLPVLRAAPHDALPELFNSLRSETNEI